MELNGNSPQILPAAPTAWMKKQGRGRSLSSPRNGPQRPSTSQQLCSREVRGWRGWGRGTGPMRPRCLAACGPPASSHHQPGPHPSCHLIRPPGCPLHEGGRKGWRRSTGWGSWTDPEHPQGAWTGPFLPSSLVLHSLGPSVYIRNNETEGVVWAPRGAPHLTRHRGVKNQRYPCPGLAGHTQDGQSAFHVVRTTSFVWYR